ncbi:hypothetical protein APA_4318 [Pseudanabaena sp. lw0831]|nr:hypothetical protein APA_4318 [Pseudanabaena sp. lw0831]
MEEFIEYIKILINTMGFKVFEPLIKQELANSNNDEKLYINATRGANAKGKRASDGFVVFRNSEIATDTVKSYREKGLNKLRDELIENEIIVKVEDKLVFKSDYLFSSPSAAAMVIMGRSANGLLEWKDSSGKALRDIEKQEISKANKQIQLVDS